MNPFEVFHAANEHPWEEVAPGITRQILGYDAQVMLVGVRFETGAVGVMHKHIHSQVTSVRSGEFKLTIGDRTKILKAGDSFYVPPDSMHECVCLKAGELVDAFSPVREDLLRQY